MRAPRPAPRPAVEPAASPAGIRPPSSVCAARGRPDQAQQHPDRRGLAGAVGSEESVDRSGGDGEIDMVHGDLPTPEALGQPGGR